MDAAGEDDDAPTTVVGDEQLAPPELVKEPAGAPTELLDDLADVPTQLVETDADAPVLIAGRYRLGGALGTGGVATVSRAHDELLGREVAVKRLHDTTPEAGRYAERFEREARAAASLNHPNVVQVFDIVDGDDDDRWIVMELVPGGTLAQLLAREAPLEPIRALRLARAIASGLGAVHAQGIVHRDVKPQNILLTPDGVPKVADFGISRAPDDPSVTRTGILLGTPAFLAPEQLTGDRVGPPADVFALGLVLYQTLTGALPDAGGEGPPAEVAARRLAVPVPPPSRVIPSLPAEVDRVVARLLDRDPSGRPADGAAAATEIGGALRAVDSRAELGPTVVLQPPARSIRRPRGLLALGLAILLVAGALAIFAGRDTPHATSDGGVTMQPADTGGVQPATVTQPAPIPQPAPKVDGHHKEKGKGKGKH